MIIWTALDAKVGYCVCGDLIAWKHITNIGHENIKCNGKVLWMENSKNFIPSLNYTSKFEIKIPIETNERFDEIVEEVFTKYNNGEITKDMLIGRPRWYEIGNGVKRDALDMKKLVDAKVITLKPKHVSTWYANKLFGRFNQNSARIHGFCDVKLKEMKPYMDDELKAIVDEITRQDFTSTENLAYYIKCVNENLGLILINVWGNYNNALIGKIKSGIYYVSNDEYTKVQRKYRNNKKAILEYFKNEKPNENIRGVHPVKIVDVTLIEKAEAKKRMEAFKKAITKKHNVEEESNVEEIKNDEPHTKEPKNDFLNVILKKMQKVKNEN